MEFGRQGRRNCRIRDTLNPNIRFIRVLKRFYLHIECKKKLYLTLIIGIVSSMRSLSENRVNGCHFFGCFGF